MAGKQMAKSSGKHPALTGAAAKALQEEAAGIQSQIGAPQSGARIKGSKGKIIVPGNDPADMITVVVMDFVSKRVFYDTPYREGDDYRPPVCFGFNKNIKQMTPHADVEEVGGEIQNDECESCPLNQWGTDGKGKACKERRVLLVIAPGQDHLEDEFMELDIPVTSLKSFDNFVRNVADNWGVPPIGATVDISVDSDSEYLQYVFSNPQPNHDINEHFERRDEATKILENLTFEPAQEEVAPAKKAPARKKAATKKRARRA